MDSLAPLLRTAVASGDFAGLGDHVSPEVVLRTSNASGRRSVRGAEAVLAHLSAPGPGEISVWDAREFPGGVALTFEWRGATGADRRRWYVRRGADGLVDELWSSAAQPSADLPPVEPPASLGVSDVRPLSHGGNSGAALLRGTRGGRPVVLKRVTAGADWLARVTGDDGRTARLHAARAFDDMPISIRHGIVDVQRDGAAAWVVMEDLGALLLDAERRISREESRRVMRAAAVLHSAFHGRVPDGAATLEARLGMASPTVAETERAGSDLLPKQFEHAWAAFVEIVEDDVAGAVLEAAVDPAPLAGALRAAYGGETLVHGDLRDDNLGFDGDQVVLIDWDLATAGTPTVDFAWYLAQDAWRIEATHDELEADHRAAHPGLPDREVDLGMLSGLVQYGWLLAHSARIHPDPVETAWGRAELDWWVPRVRRALERL